MDAEVEVNLCHNVGDGEVADQGLVALHQLVVLRRRGRGPGQVILGGGGSGRMEKGDGEGKFGVEDK